MSTELVQLRSFYATPGFLALAIADTTKATSGIVGLIVLAESTGEIRRLYVAEGSRSAGLGRRLVEDLITRAEHRGLSRLVLNTLPTMVQAQALYRSLGFVECQPYVPTPTAGVLYFELRLR